MLMLTPAVKIVNKVVTTPSMARDINLCVNCRYFEKSKCTRLVELDVVTGELGYLDAKVARDTVCGIEGKLYVEASQESWGA